jgi:hypothetical protein
MKSETIEEIMMFLCATRFNLKHEEAKQLEQYFSIHEIEAAKEEKEEYPEEVEIEAISDTEEQVDRVDDPIDVEADVEPPLPQVEAQILRPDRYTQRRVSGRKRKHKEDDEFEHY